MESIFVDLWKQDLSACLKQ